MSDIELVSSALAAGAAAVGAGGLAGLTEAAKATVNDAYLGLKALLTRRTDDPSTAVAVLKADDRNPEAWRRLLSSARIEIDAELVAAARQLHDAVDNAGGVIVINSQGVQIGDDNRQTNTFHNG